nr:hypothetical protein [Chromobacterium haemolyticum]
MDGAVADEELQALGGIAGVQRDIGGAGLEDGEHGDEEIGLTLAAQADALFRLHAELE